jgi:DNA-directed RNA polymerase specialized sigma24 family protein
MANAASGIAAGKHDPGKDRLNADIRAQIKDIDSASGPIRARVERAATEIVQLIMPRDRGPGTRGRRRRTEVRSSLVSNAQRAGAPPFGVYDAESEVLAEFCRNLLETDFRHTMADDAALPFNYLVKCVKNRAVELWRKEHSLAVRHDRVATDAALDPGEASSPLDELRPETEELAAPLAELGGVPIALNELTKDELLLLLLSSVLQLDRDRIGGVLGLTGNATGARLRRLRNRLYGLLHDGRPRPPDRGRSIGGTASARKRAERKPR